VIKAIVWNSKIPRFSAAIPSAPMLASTTTAQPSRPKKKNPVGAPLYFTTIHSECGVRLSRTATTSLRETRDHDVHREAGIPGAERHALPQLPAITLTEGIGAERDWQPWGRRPGLSASSSGIRLKWIPSCQPFSQLKPPARGSTGVPDSLDTKQESTSGPATVSRNFVIASPVLTTAPHPPYLPLNSLSHFLKRSEFMRGLACRRRTHSEPARNGLTCTNVSGECVPFTSKDSGNFQKLTREKYCAAPGVELLLLCHRENRKPQQTTRFGCEPLPRGSRKTSNSRMGTAMCYADTDTNPDGTATAFCYCGWTQEHPAPAAADAAAETHELATDAAEAEFAATH
jgi:hypothetical protein